MTTDTSEPVTYPRDHVRQALGKAIDGLPGNRRELRDAVRHKLADRTADLTPDQIFRIVLGSEVATSEGGMTAIKVMGVADYASDPDQRAALIEAVAVQLDALEAASASQDTSEPEVPERGWLQCCASCGERYVARHPSSSTCSVRRRQAMSRARRRGNVTGHRQGGYRKLPGPAEPGRGSPLAVRAVTVPWTWLKMRKAPVPRI